MNYEHRITSDPKVMLGKPIIKGTRITVEHILMRLGEGMTPKEYVEAYPTVTEQDVLAALQYAYQVISEEKMLPLAG